MSRVREWIVRFEVYLIRHSAVMFDMINVLECMRNASVTSSRLLLWLQKLFELD